ncbi:MAG: METTL5 family protein [Desulfurococcales archaeon]|nr:METTL5 family protein [Desulfurococcales archaeon]
MASGAATIGRLARLLEEAAPKIPSPRRELEQYTTPADLALRVASHAALRGLLEGAVVADLAAGSCRLGLAALMLGAGRVVAVEADVRLAEVCLAAARVLGLSQSISFIASRIRGRVGPLAPGLVDIALTNPPFGVVRRGADWEVLSHAMEARVPRIYAILKSGNMEFHKREASRRGYRATLLFKEKFPISASMPIHRSRVRWIYVDVVLFERGG